MFRVHDEREESLIDVGMIKIRDTENGDLRWIDTSNKNLRDQFQKNYHKFEKNLKQTLQNSGVDHIDISTGKDYIKPLKNFFKNRVKR